MNPQRQPLDVAAMRESIAAAQTTLKSIEDAEQRRGLILAACCAGCILLAIAALMALGGQA